MKVIKPKHTRRVTHEFFADLGDVYRGICGLMVAADAATIEEGEPTCERCIRVRKQKRVASSAD